MCVCVCVCANVHDVHVCVHLECIWNKCDVCACDRVLGVCMQRNHSIVQTGHLVEPRVHKR